MDINWETNVKGSTLLCYTEREVTRRQKKQHRRGWKGGVCVRVRVMGRNPFSRALKGHLAAACIVPKDFPSSCAMPLMSSSEGAPAFSCLLEFHVLRREDLCVFVCFSPSYLLIILGS